MSVIEVIDPIFLGERVEGVQFFHFPHIEPPKIEVCAPGRTSTGVGFVKFKNINESMTILQMLTKGDRKILRLHQLDHLHQELENTLVSQYSDISVLEIHCFIETISIVFAIAALLPKLEILNFMEITVGDGKMVSISDSTIRSLKQNGSIRKLIFKVDVRNFYENPEKADAISEKIECVLKHVSWVCPNLTAAELEQIPNGINLTQFYKTFPHLRKPVRNGGAEAEVSFSHRAAAVRSPSYQQQLPQAHPQAHSSRHNNRQQQQQNQEQFSRSSQENGTRDVRQQQQQKQRYRAQQANFLNQPAPSRPSTSNNSAAQQQRPQQQQQQQQASVSTIRHNNNNLTNYNNNNGLRNCPPPPIINLPSVSSSVPVRPLPQPGTSAGSRNYYNNNRNKSNVPRTRNSEQLPSSTTQSSATSAPAPMMDDNASIICLDEIPNTRTTPARPPPAPGLSASASAATAARFAPGQSTSAVTRSSSSEEVSSTTTRNQHSQQSVSAAYRNTEPLRKRSRGGSSAIPTTRLNYRF